MTRDEIRKRCAEGAAASFALTSVLWVSIGSGYAVCRLAGPGFWFLGASEGALVAVLAWRAFLSSERPGGRLTAAEARYRVREAVPWIVRLGVFGAGLGVLQIAASAVWRVVRSMVGPMGVHALEGVGVTLGMGVAVAWLLWIVFAPPDVLAESPAWLRLDRKPIRTSRIAPPAGEHGPVGLRVGVSGSRGDDVVVDADEGRSDGRRSAGA